MKNKYGITFKNGQSQVVLSELDISGLMDKLKQSEWNALECAVPCEWTDSDGTKIVFKYIMVTFSDISTIAFIESED